MWVASGIEAKHEAGTGRKHYHDKDMAASQVSQQHLHYSDYIVQNCHSWLHELPERIVCWF